MQLKRFPFFLLIVILFLQCRHKNTTAITYFDSDNEEMDGMEQAMRQQFLMTRDPLLNVVPTERLLTARAYMQSLMPRAMPD
jgi:hypothetical protein